jgi:predicted membrane-bound spermidine synthase
LRANSHVGAQVTSVAFYTVVSATLGVLSMGFQFAASRLLNPHFGSSIIVWAWLISTFLAAFSIGSMLGGWISNLPTAARRRGQLAGSIRGGVGAGRHRVVPPAVCLARSRRPSPT